MGGGLMNRTHPEAGPQETLTSFHHARTQLGTQSPPDTISAFILDV